MRRLIRYIALFILFFISATTQALPPIAGSGSAIIFDGIDDYVDLGTLNGEVLGSNPRTIEAWVKTSSANLMTVFMYGTGGDAGRINLQIKDGTVLIKAGLRKIVWQASNINDGNWHHIAWSYTSGTNLDQSTVYMDGVALTTIISSNATIPLTTETGDACIGSKNGSSTFFDGEIDEVRLWDAARTQTQVQTNMYSPLTGAETGLISYWDFDEGIGTIVNDLNTTNANHGTLNNMDESDWIAGIIGNSTFLTSLSTPISDTLSVYDGDGGTLTYSLVDNDGGAAVVDDPSTGEFTYTPHTAGTHTFTYKVNDGFDDSNVATITIEVEPNIVPIAGFGSALDFDGVDDYVQLEDFGLGTSNFTIEAWVKQDTAGGDIVVSRTSEGDGNGNWLNFAMDTKLTIQMGRDTESSHVNTQGSAILSTNEYHHISVVREGTTITLYIDGIQDHQFTDTGIRNLSVASDIGRFGGWVEYNSNWLNGQMDDIRIWNIARTQADIQANMYKTLQGDEAGLIGYWSFDENTGSVASDQTGNDNDGAINGSTWVSSTVPIKFVTSLGTPISDALPAYDSDGGTLTYSLVDNDGGAVTLDDVSTGEFTYTPHTAGIRTFTYQVSDGFDNSNIVTVTVEVSPNNVPIAGFGSALSFDGVGDHVSIASLDLANQSMTLEFLAKRDSSTGGGYVLGQGANVTNNGLHLGWLSAETPQFAFYYNDLYVDSNTLYSDTNWHHWAATYDATTKQRAVYRDGIKIAENTASVNYQGTGSFHIGSKYGGSGGLDGIVDEVRVWNTALTEEQVKHNTHLALTGAETGLLGYWSFNTGSGTTAIDSSGNNRNGILSNMVDADWVDVNTSIPVQLTTSLSTPFSGFLPAYDNDDDVLIYSLVNDDGGAAILDDASTGAFTYTPHTAGTHTFTYKVNDGFDDSNIATVTVEVEPNIAPVAGFGFALDFDGVDDYVSTPSRTDTPSATVEAWLKVDDSSQGTIMNNGGDGTGETEIYFLLSNGSLYAYRWGDPAGDQTRYDGLVVGRWFHVAVVFTTSKHELYINGELVDAKTGLSYPNVRSVNNNWGIAEHRGSSGLFNGKMDEVRIWSTARTQAQIQANMYTTLTGSETGLVNYWNFDEGTGTTANDLSTSSASHGTLNNMDASAWVREAVFFATQLGTVMTGALPAYDRDGSTLIYSLVDDDGGAAVLTDSSTGAFTYTPAFAGTRTFTYKVSDGFDDSNIATVTVNVTSLIVDSLNDTADGDYSTGQNTLREAVANADVGETITFADSIAGQTILLNSQITLDQNITINGSDKNISISGQDSVRVFQTASGNITLNNLTIKNGDTTGDGGGVYNSGATLTINNSNIINNNALHGGGIYNSGVALTINSSSLLNNSSLHGGGIFGSVTLNNSTIANNFATGAGGGMRPDGSIVIVNNCTIVNNQSAYEGAGIRSYGSTIHLKNTIIANNDNTNGVSDDCYLETGSLSTDINNLIESGNCGSPVSTDDPQLETLALNEADTFSFVLQATSPAVNAGDAATCEVTDQRGISRTAYDICDIGAYELILTPTDPSSFTPTIPTYDNLASGVVLSWIDSLYEDEYILSRDGADLSTLTQDTTSYTDTAISCGSTYTYSLKAKNSSGESNIISTIPATMPACPEPVTPIDFVANIPSFGDLDPEIGLSWANNNAYEDNYILSRGSNIIATLDADTTNYTDRSVNCGSTYNYSLKATNEFGESDNVSVTAVMPACPLSVPNEPINFAAVPSYNQVTLSWTDSSSLESGYKILRDGVLIDTVDSDIESYTDKGLSCETTYGYEIYAYNSAGDSIIQTLSVTTETCPSLTPGNLSAVITAHNITLAWEDVEGETGYLVTRESLTTRRTRAITEFDLPADTTTFTDSGFECGQSYDYAVAAITDTGTSEAASITVDAEACPTLPTAPDQLVAESITYTSASLRWSDNSGNETGFYVTRNNDLAKDVFENTESVTIRGLACETTYSFQIIAYNAQGQASSESIFVTTSTCPLVNLVAPSHFETYQLAMNQIRLTWNDNSLNETGFPIARNGEFIAVAPINAESFVDTDVSCGAEYTYHLYVTDDVLNLGGLEEIVTMPDCLANGDFYVHLNTVGSGTINNCSATSCSLVATAGTTIHLLATPNDGWQFSHWSGDCTGSQLLVDAEKNCLAHFTPIIVEPEPTAVNPLDPTTPTGAVPVPQLGSDLCGASFTNHNTTTGNLSICDSASVSGGNFIGDNANSGLMSNFTLNTNAMITGGRISGFNTNNGTLQDLTITQYTEVTGGFYAGSIDNNGTIFDSTVTEGSTVYSSTGQGTIVGVTQSKGTIQGKMKLGVNSAVIGGIISGEIIAPAKSPAYIGQAEILAGSTLQNVYLSPTVKLPRDVTLINVKQASNPAEPSLDDFGVKMDQLDNLDARSIIAVEPAAIALFDRYEITSIPTAAFAGMTPDQIAAFESETLSNISVAQFEHLPPEALAGFTADNVTAFSPEVMQSLTPEQLQAFNPEAIQQAEQVAKLLTNIQPDTPQELINKILPQSWEVSSTGKIIPAVGSKLSFKGLLNRLPSNVLTPYLVDFQSSFSIGGEVANNGNSENTTVGGGFNVGLQQTPTIDSVDLDQFIFTQNEYGIFNV
ncbi:LamG-like jellyroll fold domain-containing protein, partial [Candidatus Albibeggiatoa sp. nov. NOAA]|uniref:LamG-like jellyroll fold domain-containing protein n=1 Tax=Candidatus Albibeggiatoa sp. nov. NOAA TaxID=3162724 RepID=UPI0032FB7879|nr:cadherin-like domain-containing protein [Thiotrichaceae bacterium]